MSRSSDSGAGVVFSLTIILIWCAVCAWLWPYTLNTWLEYMGKAPQVVWWQGALLGFVPYLGRLSIAAAVITWFLMLLLK